MKCGGSTESTQNLVSTTLKARNQELERVQAELEDSRDRYLELYESAPIGYVTIGRQGLIEQANLTAAALLQESRSELLNRSMASFIFHEDLAVYEAHCGQLGLSGEPQSCEVRMVRNGGKVFWAQIQSAMAMEKGESVSRMVISDITTRKQSEQGFQDSESRFRRIVQTAEEGIITIDIESIIDFVNPKMGRMLGYSVEEMEGQPLAAFMDEEGRVLLEHYVERRQRGISEQFDFRFKRKDGSDQWVSTATNPIMDADGVYIGALATFIDIADRRKAEQALRESEERYRFLADHGEDIVGLNDAKGERLYISPSYFRKTGWSQQDLESKSWRNRIHPDDHGVIERARRENLAGRNTEIVHRVCCKDGSWLWFETHCKPIVGSTGEVWRQLVWSHDITKRKEAEMSLKSSEAAFRAIFEQAAVGVAMIDSDTGGFLKLNQRACEIARLTSEELMSATFFDLTHPDDLEANRFNMEKLKAGEVPSFAIEMRFLHPDDELTWINLTVSPTWAPGENPTWHIAIVEDITARKSAEMELSATADLLARTGEMAKIGGWALDLKTQKLFWSLETCRIFEISVPEAPSLEEAIRFYAPHARPVIQAAVQAAIDSGTPYDLELQVMTAKGRIFWARSQGSAVREGGEVVKLIGTFQDINERKIAELALRESEARFRAIFEQASVGVALVDTAEGRFIDVNKRCCEIIGLPREKLTPATFMDVTHPDDLPIVTEYLENLKAGRIDGYTLEKRNITKEGTIKWVNVSVAPMWNPGEKPTRHVAVIEDINDRKIAEAQYLRELEFNKTLVNHTSVIIVLLDRAGRMEHVNDATVSILGYSREEMVGRTPWDVGIMSRQEKTRALERLQVLLKGGTNPPRETILIAKSGQKRLFSLSSLSTRLPDGTIDRIIVSGTDLTERNRMQNEILKISEQEQARIGHNLHDGVSQTMTGIASLIGALECEVDGEQRASAARIRELVQDAIQEIRRMSHTMSPAAIKNRGLGGALQLLADTIRFNHRTACTFAMDADIQIVDSEMALHVYRIAQEAANNALRHGKAKEISISLCHSGDREYVLRVVDDGVGLSKARMKKSEGIGLQVMDYRANLIGGSLDITSKPRQGVTVTCRFVRPDLMDSGI